MVESKTLPLVQSCSSLADAVAFYLSFKLDEMGYVSITPSLLSFLSVLECGINYGSEIARTLGVSRQMVAKTVKELCRLGYLEQKDGKGKQKEILFTELGEQLISDARHLLSEVDDVLLERYSEKKLNNLIQEIPKILKIIEELRS